MRWSGAGLLVVACAVAGALGALTPAADAKPARKLFGNKTKPAALNASPIGSYARGCLAGGAMLPVDGPAWQAMRLSRNRNWGHPALVGLVERLARESKETDGWPGLLIGDLAQPRGGPMLTGHRSHQIGLDADIWLMPMPDRKLSHAEREHISAISMIKGPVSINEKHWKPGHVTLIKRAASYPEVARIFIHPAIKKALCTSGQAGDWLRKVRPWWGHHYHFHVRLKCPSGSRGCANQNPPPAGDGCGKPLTAWLKKVEAAAKYKPKPGAKPKPRKELRMADLPQACRGVLAAEDADAGVMLTAAPAKRGAAQPPAGPTQTVPPPAPKPRAASPAAPPPEPAPKPGAIVPATAPLPQAKPPVTENAVAPLPSTKPKPVPPGPRAAAARATTDPNLPWLRGLATPGPPLPARKPK